MKKARETKQHLPFLMNHLDMAAVCDKGYLFSKLLSEIKNDMLEEIGQDGFQSIIQHVTKLKNVKAMQELWLKPFMNCLELTEEEFMNSLKDNERGNSSLEFILIFNIKYVILLPGISLYRMIIFKNRSLFVPL